MKITTLSTKTGFLVQDLNDASLSFGVTRAAPKVLTDGATLLARSLTYGYALFGYRYGGASGAVHTKVGERAELFATYEKECMETMPTVHLGDPGKGATEKDLLVLKEKDPRDEIFWQNQQLFLVSGIIAASKEASGGTLEGKNVAIEHCCTPLAIALLAALLQEKANVVAVSDEKNTYANIQDLFTAEVIDALVAGKKLGEVLGEDATQTGDALALFATEVALLFVGSKPGVVTHEIAQNVHAECVIPYAPIPFTTKGFAVLERSHARVLPDFLTLAGSILGSGLVKPDDDTSDPNTVPASTVEERVRSLTQDITQKTHEVMVHPEGAYIGSCIEAESFLMTWQTKLPFGRPLV